MQISHSRLQPPLEEPAELDLPPLTERETARLALVFCFFWFVANWSVNASLGYTSVASTTILSSMSGTSRSLNSLSTFSQ